MNVRVFSALAFLALAAGCGGTGSVDVAGSGTGGSGGGGGNSSSSVGSGGKGGSSSSSSAGGTGGMGGQCPEEPPFMYQQDCGPVGHKVAMLDSLDPITQKGFCAKSPTGVLINTGMAEAVCNYWGLCPHLCVTVDPGSTVSFPVPSGGAEFGTVWSQFDNCYAMCVLDDGWPEFNAFVTPNNGQSVAPMATIFGWFFSPLGCQPGEITLVTCKMVAMLPP